MRGLALLRGISTKLRSRRLREVVPVLGCLVFLTALAWIATFPDRLSI